MAKVVIITRSFSKHNYGFVLSVSGKNIQSNSSISDLEKKLEEYIDKGYEIAGFATMPEGTMIYTLVKH